MKSYFQKLIRGETVFCISLLFALLSMLAVKPDEAYAGYIDLRTLCLLFCLMAVTAGFQKCGIFRIMAEKLLGAQNHMRGLALVLVLLPFFSSMVITNDVALLTFVPFTILVLLLFCICFVRREPIRVYFKESSPLEQPRLLAVFAVLFLMCLLTIFHVLSYQVLTLCVLACMLLFSRDLFRSVDYFLLATFICFFIFSGNLGRMEAVRAFLSGLMEKNGMLTAVLSSQVISNVPAAVLLSSFTENWKALLLGTNLGGLGTPIASLASLISLKFYLKTEQADLKSYLLLFLSLNAGGLLLLLAAACIL